MKKIILLSVLLLVLTSCWTKTEENKSTNTEKTVEKEANNTTNEEYVVDESDFVDGKELIKDIEKSWDLTQEEKDWLILMREEEKLAYDVYVTMYKKWNKKTFDNISDSEKTHMNAVLDLLTSYNLEDPITDNTVWVFTSENLQKLYNDLVAKGNKSLLDALIVAITIEDLDIYDLDELSLQTDKKDILTVYDNLNRGSRNHMRAFYKQLIKEWWEYEVQFITEDKYKEIIDWEQEKWTWGGKGNWKGRK